MTFKLIASFLLLTAPGLAQTPAGGGLFAKPVDLKLLVLSANGTESSFAAIKLYLQHMGIPFDTALVASDGIPALSDGNKGFYQGIILATGSLSYQSNGVWQAALTPANWAILDAYCHDYKVRLASFYTFPEARFGMQPMDTVTVPTTIQLQPAAASVFPYLNLSNPIKFAAAYAYVAKPYAAAGETTTELMQINGATAGVLHTTADGREYLALTMDHNSFLFHSLALYYGVFNWVTKGVFVGEHHIYFTPQNDDLFLPNRLFVSYVPACRPTTFIVDQNAPELAQCPLLRLNGDDLHSLRLWQQSWNANPQTKDFKITMTYNTYGSTAKFGAKPDDSLVAEALQSFGDFLWLSHTYDHKDLDCYAKDSSGTCRPANYDESSFEISENKRVADILGIPSDALSLVTPGVTGLLDPDFLNAAADQGIHYLVSDTSHPEWIPSIPNTGMYSTTQPNIFIVPRRATSLFFNSASGFANVEGSEPDEYNAFYGPDGFFRVGGTADGPAFFNSPQSYDQILDTESNNLLTYMLRGEIYPSMFHQSNFWRYDGAHSLFTDLADRIFQKFTALSNLPVLSLPQSVIGARMEERLKLVNFPIQATIDPMNQITLNSAVAISVPVTGVCAANCESYGGQKISRLDLSAGQPLVVPAN